MDKYTVDLDQVLNDFEYSELTDQQSKTAAERPPINVPFQPPPVTKHSINNVFHSLNEYLNSGINSGCGSTSLKGDNHHSPDNPEKSNINDNNVNYNPEEAISQVKDFQNSVSENIIDSLEDTFHGQPNAEHIGEEVNGFNPDKKVDELSKLASSLIEDIIILDQDFQMHPQEISSSLVEFTEKNSRNVIDGDDEKNVKKPEILPAPIKVPNDTFEKSYVDSIKTETFMETTDFSLLETENIESQSLPELNCTESFLDKESSKVNNYPECDSNIIDKADSALNKDEANFGDGSLCYFEVNNSVETIREKAVVNSVENIEEEKDLNKSRENILVNIEEDSFQSVHTEKFVIEPSESPYAVGRNSVQEKLELNKDFNEQPKIAVQEKEKSTTEIDIHSADFEQCNKDVISEPNAIQPEEAVDKTVEGISNSKYLDLEQPSDLLENTNNVPINSEGNIAPQKIVGFSTDIDIDESELNKMLEDLELEQEAPELENSVAIEEIQEEKDLEINSKEVTTEVEVIGIVQKEEGTKVPSDQIEEVKDVLDPQVKRSEIEPNLDHPSGGESIEHNAKPAEKNLHPQIIECLEMEKPSSKSKKSSRGTTHSEHSSKQSVTTIQQTVETAEKQSESIETDDVSEDLSREKEQSQESFSRPQNLPLNNELKDENLGRKIDLIGSPGSTPYNNVYINKSIKPKTTQDNESDYTSSASPTFSDCSTESTSTASTVSVEDVPNNASKFSKTTLGVKNTNVESETARAAARVQAVTEVAGNTVQENINPDQLTSQDTEGAASILNEAANTENTLNTSELAAGDSQVQSSHSTDTFLDKSWLGKEAPLWIPDADAAACLHCDMKFTVLKRRHHCRACGLVLCSKCCNLKFRLEYLDTEARVCNKCHEFLNKDTPNNAGTDHNSPESGNSPAFRPNPNNPLEYCSTVSPLQQAGHAGAPPPSVMVPVGVLKRKGSNKKSNKSVMFCDGIAPGSDLTNLDQDFNYNSDSKTHKTVHKEPEEVRKKEEPASPPAVVPTAKVTRNQPKIDQDTECFIPKSETNLPPTISANKTDILYSDCSNSPSVVEMLKNEALVFAITQDLFVHVRVISMSCCINKQAWCFCTEGLINVGSDEVVYLIEYIEEESFVPKDVFFHVHNVYMDAVKGTSIKELGLSLHNTSNFLDSRNHAGFVYLKPTFQCLENVIVPKEPYLIGILIHRWETPWAKLFPLRLILRLGAEYRYYPSPLISTRHRDSVFVEIGHTIINLLADFRNFTYTLPQIRGLIIHMEDKKTTITIPKNRYDQVMKSINNSSEHILAFAGNFSPEADSHLVCIQDTQGHENCYTTHAINIHNKPRKVTGASFIVFNGSLKSSSGLTAKSNIVEDGLMIQIPSEHMDKIRDNLRHMKNHTIACGCVNATSDESVNIVWGENDVDFNVGVQSPVDLSDMKGVPSIRVHNGIKNYNGTRLIRWTEVFILQSGEENPKNQDPVDISKVSESIARACCNALVKYLDLLVSNSCQKIGIRTTLHVENVSYSAGSNGLKLPPIYMRSLDNELVPLLNRITSNNLGDNAIVLELIFRILNA